MPIKISDEGMRLLEQTGFGLGGDIGGLPRTTYYTPDGRKIRALPNIHVNQAGQSRDANLDQGWLLSPPKTLKPFCKACDRWHDTPKEVAACMARQKHLVRQAGSKAKHEEVDRTAALEKEVAELKSLIGKLMEGKADGSLFQREVDEPSGKVPREVGS
mgnify:CR=1 FL=1